MTKKELEQALHDHVPAWPSPSPIHGVGLFALRNIACGENLFRGNYTYCSYLKVRDVRRMPEWMRRFLVERFCCDDSRIIPVPNSLRDGEIELGVMLQMFMNASQDPNTHYVSDDTDSWCRALKDIKAGEEITARYDVK